MFTLGGVVYCINEPFVLFRCILQASGVPVTTFSVRLPAWVFICCVVFSDACWSTFVYSRAVPNSRFCVRPN